MYYASRWQVQTCVSNNYPLPIDSDLRWQAVSAEQWQCTIELPDIPTQHIIVPSFAALGVPDYQFQFSCAATNVFPTPLNRVPSTRNSQSPTQATTRHAHKLSTHIDCWHSHQVLNKPVVTLTVTAARCPMDALLTVSIRPLLDYPCVPDLQNSRAQAQTPTPISQIQAAQQIRHRICSPTALAMVLAQFGPFPPWPLTIRGCYDQATRAYGAWPQAIRWASLHNVLGAVEAVWDWQTAATVLTAGIPMITSINFAKGQLTGAPLNGTSGHLVVLYGLKGDTVLVADPAAPTHDEVLRTYDIEQFGHAWLHHRGAAYIFC